MEQQINIAALLKDCPKGTKLYSPVCGECEFDGITYYQEYVKISFNKKENGLSFDKYGHLCDDENLNGECLLFPSKENRDWSTFKKPEEEQPKFKVGDVVKVKNCMGLHCITAISGDKFSANGGMNYFENHYKDTIVSLATPEEIAEWNEETLHPNHLHYSKSKRKIIHWFLPFDRVVERCKDDDMLGVWSAGLFSHYDKETSPLYPYHTIAGMCNECLPYNSETAKLIGTTDDYKEGIK